MDFTLNTIMGDRSSHDCANFVMRNCLFLARPNNKRLSLGWAQSFQKRRGTKMGSDEDDSVASLQKNDSKIRGHKSLGSGPLHVPFLVHNDSCENLRNKRHDCVDVNINIDDDDDDDETASTVDMDEDSYEFSVFSRRNASQSESESDSDSHPWRQSRRRVSFGKELVTAVYTRPRTTIEDRYCLYYDEYDFMDFKSDYRIWRKLQNNKDC